MTRTSSLYELQQTELALEAGQRRMAAIAAELNSDSSVRPSREAAATAAGRLQQLMTQQRDLELEIGGISAKAEELHKQLYSGKGGSPKQLTEKQTELDSLKRRQRTVEDTLLEVMLEIEEASEQVKQTKAALAAAEADLAASQAKLRQEQATLTAQLDQLTARQEMAEMMIPAEDRAMYDGLRRRKGGQAIARVSEGACSVCGMAQSSSILQHVRQGNTLIQCVNCERILYMPGNVIRNI